jgi:ribosome-interacting GTPase 1
MPANVTPHYQKAERIYLEAKTTEQKIRALKRMIALAPSHKGAENLRANLKKRLARLKYTKEKEIRKKKSGKKEGLRKTGDAQVAIIGMANTGKSSLLSCLTNAKPKIASYEFTTIKPEIGTMLHEGYEIQIIEIPAITGNKNNDRASLAIARDAEMLIIIAITKEELSKTLQELKESGIEKKKIIVMNKGDQKIPLAINMAYLIISCKTKINIEELKKKIIEELKLIRVYTKDIRKKAAEKPIVFHGQATIKQVCEKVNKIFVEKFLFAKVWGKSVKFPGQQVGSKHKIKDKDIVEIHLKD